MAHPFPIPESHRDLLEKRAFAQVATLMPNGSPQVSPMWVDYDGTHIRVNSARGRQKDRNLRARPQVALDIQDPDSPYRHLAIRGRVVEVIEGPVAEEHIDRLAYKYTGAERYPGRSPGEIRVMYKIEPRRVATMG